MLVEVRVKSLGLDRGTNTPVVILQEVDGERVLPIWIGPGEASAIAMQLADMSFSRPLTHDLLVSVLGGLGGVLEKVVISRVESDTYYAELVVRHGDEVVTVDARPSDSIAVSLRTDARIYALDDLLERVSIEVSDDPSVVHLGATEEPDFQQLASMNPEELQAHLRSLNPQDFGRFTP